MPLFHFIDDDENNTDDIETKGKTEDETACGGHSRQEHDPCKIIQLGLPGSIWNGEGGLERKGWAV